MKVLLVTNEEPGAITGGLGEFIGQMKRHLVARGVDARVLFVRYLSARRDAQPTEEVDYVIDQQAGYPVETPEGRVLNASYEVLAQALPLLQGFDPDVIHCNDRQAWLPFRALKNVVFSLHLSMGDLKQLHGIDERWLQEYKIEMHAMRHAPLSIVYSRFMRERMWRGFAPEASPVVLPLGFEPNLVAEAGKPRPQPQVVSFFGRLNNGQKGLLEFVRAVRILTHNPKTNNRDNSIEFRVHGKGDVPAQAADLPITFTGLLRGDDLRQAYHDADVVVMPSRYEPFGLVGLEAMAAGCLLLATQGLGMDEYLIPGVNGVAITPHGTAIADVLTRVLQQWERYRQIIERGKSAALAWSWERSAAAHERVYRLVAAGRTSILGQLGSKEYQALLARARWTHDSPKPGLDATALEALINVARDSDELLSGNPNPSEWAVLYDAGAACPLRPGECSTLSLETLDAHMDLIPVTPEETTFICLAGLEFCMDAPAALRAIAACGFNSVVLGLLTGTRLHQQTYVMDDVEEVTQCIAPYHMNDPIRCAGMTILRFAQSPEAVLTVMPAGDAHTTPREDAHPRRKA